MNSKQLVLTTLLAFVIVSSISIGNISVYATGGLDDEEEEEAIKELQNDVSGIEDSVNDIQEDIEGLTLNLEEGQNALTAICPTAAAEEEPEPPQTVLPPIQNETESGCNPVPEPEPPQTVLPPIQNETESGCNPIPEPEPEQPVLEPIICPINGELLGYLNTTSGEQLPISAGNETNGGESNNTGFLPPIVIEEEEEQQEQTAVPEVTEAPQCNVTTPVEEEPEPIQNVTEPIEDIGFDLDCACFVSNANQTSAGSN